MPKSENQRRAVRKARSIPCQILRHADRQVFPELTRDLSEAGMLVGSDAGLAVGDALTVSFQAGDVGVWIDTRATVVRLVRGRRATDPGPGFGLRFDDLDPVSRLLVRGSLRRATPPLPARPRPQA